MVDRPVRSSSRERVSPRANDAAMLRGAAHVLRSSLFAGAPSSYVKQEGLAGWKSVDQVDSLVPLLKQSTRLSYSLQSYA